MQLSACVRCGDGYEMEGVRLSVVVLISVQCFVRAVVARVVGGAWWHERRPPLPADCTHLLVLRMAELGTRGLPALLESQVSTAGSNNGRWGLLFSQNGPTISLRGDRRYSVGRDSEADICVNDLLVSHRHFVIYCVVEVDAPHPQLLTRCDQVAEWFYPCRDSQQASSSGPEATGATLVGAAAYQQSLPREGTARRGETGCDAPTTSHGGAAISLGRESNEHVGTQLQLPALETQMLQPQGRVRYYVEDCSVNGTFVNSARVGKGRRCELFSGDDINIVQRRVKRKRTGGDDGQSHPTGSRSPKTREYVASFCFHVVRQTFTTCGDLMRRALTPSSSRPAWALATGTPPRSHDSAERPGSDFAFEAPHLRMCSSLAALQARGGEARKQWQWGQCIGRGTSSVVYVGIDLASGKMIAIKVLLGTSRGGGMVPGIAGAAGQTPPPLEGSTRAPRLNEDDTCELATYIDPGGPPPLTSSPAGPGVAVEGGTLARPRGSGGTCCAGEEGGGKSPSGANVELSCDAVGRASGSQSEPLLPNVTEEHLRELRLLCTLQHRRIVQYLGYQVEAVGLCILLEYVAGGTLRDAMLKFHCFAEPLLRMYTVQILQGLEYLQDQLIVHGDLKPANILLTDDGKIKISDFGTSRVARHGGGSVAGSSGDEGAGCGCQAASLSQLCGTPAYMSPELVQTQVSTFASDMWAFGCIVLEMATGLEPWHGEIPRGDVVAAVIFIGRLNRGPSLQALARGGASEELLDFLQSVFVIDAAKRPTASQLLQHPFVTGVALPHADDPAERTPLAPSLGASPLSTSSEYHATIPPLCMPHILGEAVGTSHGINPPAPLNLRAPSPPPPILADGMPAGQDHMQSNAPIGISSGTQHLHSTCSLPISLQSAGVALEVAEMDERVGRANGALPLPTALVTVKMPHGRLPVTSTCQPSRSDVGSSRRMAHGPNNSEAAPNGPADGAPWLKRRRRSNGSATQSGLRLAVGPVLSPVPGTVGSAGAGAEDLHSGLTVEFSSLSTSAPSPDPGGSRCA